MTTATATSLDIQLRDAVVHQLDWDPEIDASAIGVSAKHGVVTLTGHVPSDAAKAAAEHIAMHVHGVRAVANDLIVHVRLARTDTDLAEDALGVLRSRGLDDVQAAVHAGQIILTGTVESLHQKQQAEKGIRNIRGVIGVLNDLVVRTAQAREPVDDQC